MTETAVQPIKGLVFIHAKRVDYKGEPRKFTVSHVTSEKVFYKETSDYGSSYGKPVRTSVANFPNVVKEVVSVPETTTPDLGPKLTDAQCEALWAKAHAAGMAAGEAAVPVPMTVVQRSHPLDDTSPIVRVYEPVMDGVCGFAWVKIRPGNGSFARWAKKTDKGHKSYYGGFDIWVGAFNQSLTRKAAYANAAADVLREVGVAAYGQSRMD